MAQIIDVVMNLTDRVSDSLSNIRRNMEQTANVNKRLGATISGAGRSLGAMASALMPLSAGIVAIGTLGVKTFMDVEASIKAAAVKAGASNDEMKAMLKTAGELGAKFPISTKEAAVTMNELAAAGFDAQQVMGAMPGIIQASVASGEDLASTSNVVSSALSIWNLKIGDIQKNTEHVADVIQQAANISKLGMSDFGIAMQYAGGPAAALGVGIEELSVSMGIMANNGIEASTIGTSLRSAMLNLAKPTKSMGDALATLGVEVTDSNGKFIGMHEYISRLRTAMVGMTDMEKASYLTTLAGKEAVSGLMAVVNTTPDAYDKMRKSIETADGSSAAAFEAMRHTTKGAMMELQGAIESFELEIGQALVPYVLMGADALKGLLAGLQNLPAGVKEFAVGLAASVVGMTGFLFAASGIMTAVGGLVNTYSQISKIMSGGVIRNKALQLAVQGVIRGFQFLRVAMLGAMGPIGIAVAAIGIAAYQIYSNWDKLAPFFQNIWTRIKGAFYTAVEMIRTPLIRLQGAWQRLTRGFREGAGVFGVLNAISDVLAGVLGGILYAAFVRVSAVVTGVFVAAFNIIGIVIGSSLSVLGGLIDFITGVFTGNWTLAWQGVYEIFSNIFGGLVGIAKSVVAGIRAAINSVIAGINNVSFTAPEWTPGVGGKSFGPLNIPMLATGTDNWQGGPAVIHDAGAEIVDLPSGTRVIPHDKSMREAFNSGAKSAGGISINISGVTINNGADINEFAKKVAARIQYEMEKEAINRTVGAI